MPKADPTDYIPSQASGRPSPNRSIFTPEQVAVLNYLEREIRPAFSQLEMDAEDEEAFRQLCRSVSSWDDLSDFRALYNRITASS